MTRTTSVAVSLALSAITTFAGPLQRGDVSASAKWVAHIDVESFAGSQVGATVIARAESEAGADKLQWLRDTIGLDPMEDLKSVTLYGSDYTRGEGVAIVRGQLDEAALLGMLDGNDTHQEVVHGDRVIHSWTDPQRNRPASGCFYAPDVLVLGARIDEVKHAIDVLTGDAPAAADDSLPPAANGAILSVAAQEHNGRIGHHAQAAIMQNATRLAFTLGESGVNMVLSAAVSAGSDEGAQQIEQVVNGMRAFMLLSGENNPAAAQFAQNLQITRSGQEVTIGAQHPAADVVALMEAGRQHRRGGGNHGAREPEGE